MNIYNIYRMANYFYRKNIPLVPMMLKIIIRIVFSAVIPYKCKIGKGTILGYQGLGIVIHPKSEIGERCIISQGVTIGGTTKKIDVPIIGDNVIIGSGAKILGDIKVGNNVVIGANAVVLNNIESNCVVGGIPAKIIKRNIDINKYR